MNNDDCGSLIAVVAAIAGVLACPATSFFMQKFGNWGKISDKYPLQSPFEGQWLNWQTITFGKPYRGIFYRGCISIGFSKDFMYLKVMPELIFPFMKPMQIPWSAIRSIEQTKFLWANYCIFTTEDGSEITIYRGRGFTKYLAKNAALAKPLRDYNAAQQAFPDV